jgi:subtilisin family serine protease
VAYDGPVRRPALATLICAAPLFMAAPATASPGPEGAALKQVLRTSAHAAGRLYVPLPLPETAPSPALGSSASARRAARRRRVAAARAQVALARDNRAGRLLVGVRGHGDLPGVRRTLLRLGARTASLASMGVLAVRAPSVAAVARALGGDRRVAYVERDGRWQAADPFDNIDPATNIPYTWAYDAVRAGEALQAAGGGSNREVAVIDTGVDTGHPDLAGRLGRPFDTFSGGTDVTDQLGHGTFVTGLIAAVDGNDIGGRGVAGATTVFPVRASLDGGFTVGDVLRALDFAIRSGADVANLSLAGDTLTRSQSRALVVTFLNDVLPVAASGNHGARTLEFPAAGIGGRRGGRGIGLSVAATLPDGRPAAFSTHNDYVSVAAPGGDLSGCEEGVFSTIPHDSFQTIWDDPGSCSRVFSGGGGRWAYAEGTSFSAPIAAGIAAVVWRVQPRLASEQVADVLVRSAHQTMPGARWNEFTGSGIVDGKAGTDLARVYDVRAPRLHARARRRSGSTVAVRVSRSRDRTNPGHELARRVTYAVLVSSDRGQSYRFAVRPRRRPFRATVHLRGRRANLILASVCDGNGNCASKRLGRFRRR